MKVLINPRKNNQNIVSLLIPLTIILLLIGPLPIDHASAMRQATTRVSVRVALGMDDAEEREDGSMSSFSSDLELIFDKDTPQTVGIRFRKLNIPQGAEISNAYIQFKSDEVDKQPARIIIWGEASGNASTFLNNDLNITSRPITETNTIWEPPPWEKEEEIGSSQRTPDLSRIVQEIVSRPDWAAGNALAFIFTGTGTRVAKSFEGDMNGAPLLIVEYVGDPIPTLAPEQTPTPYPAEHAIQFAVIGDYGNGSNREERVAALVDSWNPDFVITTGDNYYSDDELETIDDNIGRYYSKYIGNYSGEYGIGAAENRFWPAPGNHDWHSIYCDGAICEGPYIEYFELPGNELYYQVDYGLVEIFAIDSDSDNPDGIDKDTVQAAWLNNALANSAACFKLVYGHRPPYSSGSHGPTPELQWPFAEWGADAVFSGHDHNYERLHAGGIPYFVNGAGGVALNIFPDSTQLPTDVRSIFRYNEDNGAMLVSVYTTGITYQFYNTLGELVDELTVVKDCSSTYPDVITWLKKGRENLSRRSIP